MYRITYRIKNRKINEVHSLLGYRLIMLSQNILVLFKGMIIMKKELKDMTNEELWTLFPIIIESHNPNWKNTYYEEKKVIEKIIGSHNIERISHYGSTAVPNLLAKPIIDILIEIKADIDIEKLISSMKGAGYIYSPQPNNPAPHMMFLKGYTLNGFKGQVYHIHVRYLGDWDELYFRDYLLSHPNVVEEYGKLKLSLKQSYEHDRDGYTNAKTDFIKKATKLAKEEVRKMKVIGSHNNEDNLFM